ncbi:hypothetical protein IKE_04569 [Bacillus cereus VD196]|uniref:Bacterial Ig domain-containing protein n=1 Tax=Bacillus cereus VD196 TaxID=1053243 RepID=A0A9W5V776_BACCE|nr:Ig-like domain-containing protein [Bacillus cereus]EOO64344.1 hypothetical protein IKE_04569 [Bacillus cereus VD196]
MEKQKKRMNQLKPINVVTTAAIVATTLFTPIVEVLPGKYNIVHAEETQNPAKYGVINASNKWAGLKIPYSGKTQYYGNYVNFKSDSGNVGFYADPLKGNAQTAVEAKVKTDTAAADLKLFRSDLFEYNLANRQWTYDRVPFTPLTNEVPQPGVWGVWKVTYDKIAQKKTLYLNGKKIVERDAPTGISDLVFYIYSTDFNTKRVSADVEYINYSMFAFSPKVNPVTDAQTKLTGFGNSGATVTIESNGMPGKYKGTADENGNFSIDIPKQKAGTELTVTQELDGSTSEKTVVTVKDGTAPDAPMVNFVTNQDTKVTGTGEKGAKATVKIGNGEYEGTVDEKGNYAIDIPEQPVGTELSVTLTDAAGNTSQPTKIKVEEKDKTAPDAPKVNPVTDQDTKVTGTGEKGAKVSVVVDGKEIGMGTVDDQGNYTVDIPKQPGGKEVIVTLKDAAGNTSQPTKQTVEDKTAPDAPKVDPVTDQNTKVTGIGEKGSTVKVVVDGKEVGTGKVDDQGNYTVDIPKQPGGKEVIVTLTDAAGNTSQPTTTKVKMDAASQEKLVKEAKQAIDQLFTDSSRAKFSHDFTTTKKGAIQINVTEQHMTGAMEKLRAVPDDHKEKAALQKEMERAQKLLKDREKEQEGNLVQNGLFDSGLDKWKPWAGTGASVPKVQADDEKSKNIVKIDPNSSVEQVLTGLEPNTEYELSLYVKTENKEKFSVGVKNIGTANVSVPIYSKEFSDAHLSFKTGPNATTATLYLFKSGGTGSGYADVVIAKKVMGK